MRLSCSSWSHHRSLEAGEFSLASWIEHCAKDLALDGVEIEDKHFPDSSTAALQTVRRLIADHGLALANVTTFNDFGNEEERKNASELDKVKRWIDNARALGAASLRVFAGWPKGPRQAAWDRMIPWLARAAEYAKAQGVILVLENHNHGGFIQTSADTLLALRQVDSSHLKPLLDTGNYLDGMKSIAQIAPLAAHVHAKLLKLDPKGKEVNIDHVGVFKLLAQANYQGFVSAEYEGEEQETRTVPRAIRYLRELS